ncbi:hypothetical protein BC940DRAFT_305467 [Gongronella butleri]|nr:hypothetical protein BC940DRAFT_305467 [Gongronella butleri]
MKFSTFLILLAFVACAPFCLAGVITLTNADNGRSINAHVGDNVRVTLTPQSANGIKSSWSEVASSDTHVLTKTNEAQTPSGGVSATFQASELGNGDLQATATCVSCNNANSWTVSVTIV